MNAVYSQVERVLILERHFASKSFPAIRDSFSFAYLDKKVPNNTTVYQLVKKIQGTGSV
jgi:hypothetical protein